MKNNKKLHLSRFEQRKILKIEFLVKCSRKLRVPKQIILEINYSKIKNSKYDHDHVCF